MSVAFEINNTISALEERHWPEVRRIYEEGIATGNATLEASSPPWEKWNDEHLTHSRLICLNGSSLFGWAALSPVSGRCVYGGVAEVSVYVDAIARGKGVGKRLLNALVVSSEENGIWTLQAGILKENSTSIRLHESCGFRVVGFREKLGQRNGTWRDIVLMERRSKKINY